MSRRNVAKYKKIQEYGKKELLKEVVEGKKSIHKAYSEIKEIKPTKEVLKKRNYNDEVDLIFAKMKEWKTGSLNDKTIKQIILKYLKK